MRYFPLFILLLATPAIVFATNINDSTEQKVTNPLFWPHLYNRSYHTLYCAVNNPARANVTITRLYPASWLEQAYACNNKGRCNQARYQYAYTDLHNLWPALSRYHRARGQLPFMEIPNESMLFVEDKCDFKKRLTGVGPSHTSDIGSGISPGIEPRDYAKGEIARSILYMLWKYRLPDHGMLPLMVKWANQYPVSREEQWRNEKIAGLQGNRNPFIDDKAMADIYLSIR
ncbi:endonuclease [Thalassomonas haliotis]|uniref:Endonuclease n=1 Tax=Thalassomonas haliotis TaxID=485448 RepID=A0ABY7VIK1_9GAMM|nr:endonuclease [Thalassomonas haliotis]WDE13562.1 endonuclease [Thalassomonas haliotis]